MKVSRSYLWREDVRIENEDNFSGLRARRNLPVGYQGSKFGWSRHGRRKERRIKRVKGKEKLSRR